MQVFLFPTQFGKLATWLSCCLLALLSLRPQVAHATHLRAGDIQSRVDSITGNPNHIYFKMILYRDPTKIDQPAVTIFYGDGTSSGKDAIKQAAQYKVSDDTNIMVYYFDHTFPGGGRSYTVSFVGENRVADVVNITGSVGQTFFISSTITIDPTLGLNHSPVLRAPAIDKAGLGQVFLHNPAAYDADGDSLAFKIKESQQGVGGVDGAFNNHNMPITQVCSGFRFPADPTLVAGATQVTYPGIPRPTTTPATYTQDVYTGQIMWNAPARVGYYNVAMVVEEWRRSPGGYHRLIGQVIRDMQIQVIPTMNLPPQLTVPADICVQAGQTATLTISAIDGQATGNLAPTPITLFAYSGTIPPATFRQTSTGTSVTGTYTWNTDCSNVAKEPYLVVFKAQDSPPTGNPVLIDEKPVRITVVGPPPQNLKVAASGTTGVLTWDKYTCQNASQLLIFRRENSYPYTPGPCDVGLPAAAGYTQIGFVPATATTYADDNGGAGLVRGRDYCYRIYAVFPLPSGGTSIVSNEACLQLAGRSALLTNVDVNTTGTTNGQITVRWTQPHNDNGTTTFAAPYGYRLSRATGNGPFALLADVKNSIADTTYVDTTLNTDANQYRYQLVFYRASTSNGTTAEQDDPAVVASSVRTTLVPDGVANTFTVNFAYQVPWDNSKLPARVFRRTGTATTAPYTQIGTVTPGATAGSYVDKDPTLQRNQTYCYYVQTTGQYATPTNAAGAPELTNLLNSSQQTCATLRPTPCTPVLSLRVINCDSLSALPRYPADNQTYQNSLSWTVGSAPTGCLANAVYYRVFRAEGQGGPFALLDSTSQLSYLNRLLPQQNYCYQVQGVTATGERSALSNVVCQSECVFFLLPNIFTPNGDNLNATFRPKTTSPVQRTHIQIFNRWGRKVYESDQNPYIEWKGDGTNGESTGNGPLSDGIYYYLAEVQFADSNHTQRVYKGWVEIIR